VAQGVLGAPHRAAKSVRTVELADIILAVFAITLAALVLLLGSDRSLHGGHFWVFEFTQFFDPAWASQEPSQAHLTGSLKFHDLRHLVLATWALVGALVVARSLGKDADQYHSRPALGTGRTSNDVGGKSEISHLCRLPHYLAYRCTENFLAG